jgi:hypothetical protein
MLPGLAALPLASIWALRRGELPTTVFALYGWLALGSLILMGKPGSSLLYLSEMTIALALSLGLASGWALKASRRLRPTRQTLAVAAGCLLFLALRSPPPQNPVGRILSEARSLFSHDLKRERAAEEEMVERLRVLEGPILAESPGLLIAAGKPVLANPFVLKWMARLGRFDEDRLIRDLEKGYFRAVQLDSFASRSPPRALSAQERRRWLLTRGRFSQTILDAVERYYRLSADLARGTIYLPSPPSGQKKAPEASISLGGG